MPDDLASRLSVALAKTPEWIRHELSSTEQPVRERAEEALAAMLAAALHGSATRMEQEDQPFGE